jgi:hypothetical protein
LLLLDQMLLGTGTDKVSGTDRVSGIDRVPGTGSGTELSTDFVPPRAPWL